MLTHYGLIMNVIQWTAFEDHIRHGHPQAVTGSALFTHSYGVVLGHLASWRRDSLVIFPKFDIQLMLQAVPKYHVERLYLVSPPWSIKSVENPANYSYPGTTYPFSTLDKPFPF